MITRILLAVDDSPASFHAAQVAIAMARQLGASMTIVTVLEDHVLDDRLASFSVEDSSRRRGLAAVSTLEHVVRQASADGISVSSEPLSGHPAEQILRKARQVAADLVVIARASAPSVGASYVGGVTRHVLEFTEIPVLVVPRSHLDR